MADGKVIECEFGDTIVVGAALIRIEPKSGRKVRLRIAAPADVEITRATLKETGASREPAGTPA